MKTLRTILIAIALVLAARLSSDAFIVTPTGVATGLTHSTTVSGNITNYALQPAWVTTEVFTFGASATITIPVGSFPGQALDAIVCQNGTGGYTPAFTAAGGLTITGTFPTFTTTLNDCGDFSLVYTSTTQAYIVGSQAGPL